MIRTYFLLGTMEVSVGCSGHNSDLRSATFIIYRTGLSQSANELSNFQESRLLRWRSDAVAWTSGIGATDTAPDLTTSSAICDEFTMHGRACVTNRVSSQTRTCGGTLVGCDAGATSLYTPETLAYQ
jgi:hypothetical protein